MSDNITVEHRSWNMSRIRSQNTKPELRVRSVIFNRGFRYRLNGAVSQKKVINGILPGKPDIVLSKYNTVIFVNGCFWHHHKNCKRASRPKSNTNYWNKKIKNNIERDKKNFEILTKLGWNVEIIWECQTNGKTLVRKLDKIINRITK